MTEIESPSVGVLSVHVGVVFIDCDLDFVCVCQATGVRHQECQRVRTLMGLNQFLSWCR